MKPGSRCPAGVAVVLLVMIRPILAAEPPPELPQDFHLRLRMMAAAGQDTAGLVREWQSRRGDHSFSSFRNSSSSFRQAIRNLLSAMRLEAGGNFTEAASMYRRTAAHLRRAGAGSEAVFCLLHAAELAQQEGRLEASLELLEQAGTGLDRLHPQPYLESLLLQARGYALWYLDQLQPAIRAFAAALERFRTLALNEGIVATWNNLAVLHEELLQPEQALQAYHRALRQSHPQVSPEVEFQLLANLAGFLARFGDAAEAAPYLERARHLRRLDPFEFALLECRVRGMPACLALKRISGVPPGGREVERHLVLGQVETDREKSLDLFSRALSLARELKSPYWIRKATLETGRALERAGRFREAARLFLDGWRGQRESFLQQAALYPYQRALAPLFAGRIRSLVESGQADQAWREIQEFSRRRQHGIGSIVFGASSADPPLESPGEPALRAAARGVGGTLQLPAGESPPFPRPGNFAVLELWPDGRDLFLWLFTSQGRTFRRCRTESSLAALIEESTGAFFRARLALPSASSLERLRPLYQSCFRPLEDELATARMVVIPHAELQSLPLELLPTSEGLLGDRMAISYLPRWRALPPEPIPTGASYLLKGGADAPAEESWLRRIDPSLRTVEELPNPADSPLRAGWIHVSSHFRLQAEDWLVSELGDGSAMQARHLLSANFQCRLLSLGMCDAGKEAAGNPYWLGLAELLLGRQAGALLLSRWKLDDFSLQIYRAFYENLQAGWTADLALQRARSEFRSQWLIRDGNRQWSDHPFFWGGISYVGHPDLRLSGVAGSEPVDGPPRILVMLATLVPALWAGLLLRMVRRSTRSPGGRPRNLPPD